MYLWPGERVVAHLRQISAGVVWVRRLTACLAAFALIPGFAMAQSRFEPVGEVHFPDSLFLSGMVVLPDGVVVVARMLLIR